MNIKIIAALTFLTIFNSICGIASEQDVKTFVIAVENIEYLPFYGVDQKKPENYIGFAREFLDSFAKKHGYVFKYQPLPVKRLFKEFLNGMYDFKYPDNPFWSADDKKGKTIFYSESVTDYTDGIMVHADNKHINLDDLMVIGTVRGFTAWDYLGQIKSGKLELVENNTLFGLLQQVAMKRIDGCYVNNAVAARAIKESENALTNIVFAPHLPHTKSSYKLSTQKHPQIIEELNRYLQENKKEIDEMRSRYKIVTFADQQSSSETIFNLEEKNSCPNEEKPKELTILMREFNQPYVFEDGTGIISDIFKESLGSLFKLNFVFLPYERGLLMLQQNQLDVVSIAPETAEGMDACFVSKPYIEFQNVAFTLDSGPLKEVKINDLGHLDIIAFVNARIFLGDKFAQQIENNAKYKEIQDQKGQVRALLKGRTEVAILEKNIFEFYRHQLIKDAEIDPVLIGKGFNIFPSSRYCAIFREKNVMEAFNHGIEKLQQSGRYQAIIASYTKKISNPE